MNREPKQIVQEIIALVSELAALAGTTIEVAPTGERRVSSATPKDKSGATGGIRLLIENGALDSPKDLPDVVMSLSQEGRHYSKQTISMALLSLVRERVLTRFKDGEKKNWKYAVRR